MEGSSKNDQNNKIDEEEEIIIQHEEVAKVMQSLPVDTFGKDNLIKLVNYQGFWCGDFIFKNVLAYQKHFQARDSDLIIANFPKTGTTWLKALLFAVVNRGTQNLNLLLQNHPHELVYNLESDIYGKAFDYPQPRHLDQIPSPRLFSTHLPYHSLPQSIRTSKCRILCLARNPLDMLVSYFYFSSSVMEKISGDNYDYQHPTMEDCLEKQYYQGKIVYGPFFDHVIEYWEKSSEQPNKIIFLLYEDLKDDIIVQVKRIAEFIGFPFSPQEESEGVVQEIIKLCSFNNLKDLEANKNGVINKFFEKKSYFRKGEVGDWTNYFTPPMVDRAVKFMEDKISGTGLSFRFNSR